MNLTQETVKKYDANRFKRDDIDVLKKQISLATSKLYNLENGWGDEDDSLRPDEETIADAENLFQKIAMRVYKETHKNLSLPYFNPDYDGSVQLYWKQPFLLSITVHPNIVPTFYGEVNGTTISSKNSNMNELYSWLVSQINDTKHRSSDL